MADFQPPPTYALPILVDERTGRSSFNPIWLKWFIDLTEIINASGGGGGAIQHNDTGGLQGGTANQYYHLTSAQQVVAAAWTTAQQALVAKLASANGSTLHPPTAAGASQTASAIFAGNGAPSNGDGSNGDFYFRGDGAAATFIYHKAAGAWTAFA